MVLTILFLLLAAGVYFLNIPLNLVSNLVVVVGCFGIFITSYFVSRILTTRGIFIGLICGLVIDLVIFTVSFLVTGKIDDVEGIIKMLAIFFSACLGGILGGRLK